MRTRALALVLAAGLATAGCAAAAGGTSPAAGGASPAASRTAGAAPAPVYGPPAPDPACAAALAAQQTLQARQVTDSGNESALDRDFTNFANALNDAAQRERHPAAARAMTALAGDYTAMVQSQSGGAELPAMATVTRDGTAFGKAC